MMPSEEMSVWIAALAGDDAGARARAAHAIYDAGSAAARAATRAWRSDTELARLFTGQPTVGLAVRPETFEEIRRASGAPKLAAVPPDQDAREFELHFPGGVSLDILTTRDPRGSGAIARFLERRGERIQQVELPVAGVDRATALLRERLRIDPVYAETRAGADGTRVNFFLVAIPASSASFAGEKILIELVETAAPRN
jgi:hypothetical protein